MIFRIVWATFCEVCLVFFVISNPIFQISGHEFNFFESSVGSFESGVMLYVTECSLLPPPWGAEPLPRPPPQEGDLQKTGTEWCARTGYCATEQRLLPASV